MFLPDQYLYLRCVSPECDAATDQIKLAKRVDGFWRPFDPQWVFEFITKHRECSYDTPDDAAKQQFVLKYEGG